MRRRTTRRTRSSPSSSIAMHFKQDEDGYIGAERHATSVPVRYRQPRARGADRRSDVQRRSSRLVTRRPADRLRQTTTVDRTRTARWTLMSLTPSRRDGAQNRAFLCSQQADARVESRRQADCITQGLEPKFDVICRTMLCLVPAGRRCAARAYRASLIAPRPRFVFGADSAGDDDLGRRRRHGISGARRNCDAARSTRLLTAARLSYLR